MSHDWYRGWAVGYRYASVICVVYVLCFDNLGVTSQQNWCQLLCFYVSTILQRRSRASSYLDAGAMQTVLQAAARDHVTPAFREVHGLSDVVRVNYKLCFLVHKTLLTAKNPARCSSRAPVSCDCHAADKSKDRQRKKAFSAVFCSCTAYLEQSCQQKLKRCVALRLLGVNLR